MRLRVLLPLACCVMSAHGYTTRRLDELSELKQELSYLRQQLKNGTLSVSGASESLPSSASLTTLEASQRTEEIVREGMLGPYENDFLMIFSKALVEALGEGIKKYQGPLKWGGCISGETIMYVLLNVVEVLLEKFLGLFASDENAQSWTKSIMAIARTFCRALFDSKKNGGDWSTPDGAKSVLGAKGVEGAAAQNILGFLLQSSLCIAKVPGTAFSTISPGWFKQETQWKSAHHCHVALHVTNVRVSPPAPLAAVTTPTTHRPQRRWESKAAISPATRRTTPTATSLITWWWVRSSLSDSS